jgi:nitrate/nitrite transport system substrate-binding protein
MSTFDNPFDPSRRLQRCSCGRHVSQAEHDRAAATPLQCVAEPANGEKRYQGVVASAVMRAVFPKDR